jgi:hypothetical protein
MRVKNPEPILPSFRLLGEQVDEKGQMNCHQPVWFNDDERKVRDEKDIDPYRDGRPHGFNSVRTARHRPRRNSACARHDGSREPERRADDPSHADNPWRD